MSVEIRVLIPGMKMGSERLEVNVNPSLAEQEIYLL